MLSALSPDLSPHLEGLVPHPDLSTDPRGDIDTHPQGHSGCTEKPLVKPWDTGCPQRDPRSGSSYADDPELVTQRSHAVLHPATEAFASGLVALLPSG